jgi:tetratricopeptide (TPR) repeat protein
MNAHFQQAVVHFQKGDARKAQECVNAALAQEPQNGDAWHLQGVLALNAGQNDQAIQALTKATALLPTNAVARTYLASAFNVQRRHREAEAAAGGAIALNAAIPEAHFELGQAFARRGQCAEAVAPLDTCLRLRPDWVEAKEMLAHCLYHAGQHEAALQYARAVLSTHPDRPLPHRTVAEILCRRQQDEESIAHYQTALKLAPEDGDTYGSYAVSLTRMGREDEALRAHETATKLHPSPLGREAYAFTLLAAGRFSEGWPHYVASLKPNDATWVTRDGPPPPPALADVAGQPVLAWLNQGVGDQIMFASLVPDIIAAGARLTLECDARLVPLFRRSFGEDVNVRPAGDPARKPEDAAAYRYQMLLADTARWLRPRFDAFPRRAGYLKADPARTRKLRQRYAERAGGRPVIGISWRTAHGTKVGTEKTLALMDWGPVLAGRSALFVDLQYLSKADESGEAARAHGADILHDDTIDPFRDLDAFAAQVAAMDLVITTSNATAHMAGSLNVPVWTLVSRGVGAMWHWFRDRNDSPWYPSMRLFRQPKPGAWKPALTEAGTALSQFIAAWPH